MPSTLRLLPLAAAVLLLAGCDLTRSSVVVQRTDGGGSYEPPMHQINASPPPGGSYRVAKGDTLYSIAFRNKVDFRELARWNNIDEPYTIWPGQDLKLSPGAPVVVNRPPPVSTPSRVIPAPVVVASHTPPPPPPGPVFEDASKDAPPPTPVPQPQDAPVSASSTVVVAGVGTVPATPSQTAKGAPPVVAAPAPSVEAPTPTIVSGATRTAAGIGWRWPADGNLVKKFSSGDAIPGIEITGKAGDPIRAAADGVVVYSGNGLVGYGELVIIKHSDSFLSAYGHNRKRLVKEGEHVKSGQVVAEMGNSGASRDELQFQIRRDGNPVDPLAYLPAK